MLKIKIIFDSPQADLQNSPSSYQHASQTLRDRDNLLSIRRHTKLRNILGGLGSVGGTAQISELTGLWWCRESGMAWTDKQIWGQSLSPDTEPHQSA